MDGLKVDFSPVRRQVWYKEVVGRGRPIGSNVVHYSPQYLVSVYAEASDFTKGLKELES